MTISGQSGQSLNHSVFPAPPDASLLERAGVDFDAHRNCLRLGAG